MGKTEKLERTKERADEIKQEAGKQSTIHEPSAFIADCQMLR